MMEDQLLTNTGINFSSNAEEKNYESLWNYLKKVNVNDPAKGKYSVIPADYAFIQSAMTRLQSKMDLPFEIVKKGMIKGRQRLGVKFKEDTMLLERQVSVFKDFKK